MSSAEITLHVAAIGGEGYRRRLAITGLLPLLLAYTGWRCAGGDLGNAAVSCHCVGCA